MGKSLRLASKPPRVELRSLSELYSVLRCLSLQLCRRPFRGEILSLALMEREAYPQNGTAVRFGAQHLDGERGESCRTLSSCESCLLASFRGRCSHSWPARVLSIRLSAARRI